MAIRRYQREVDQFDQALAGFLGVNRTDLRCLDFLVEAPRSARDLARATGLTPSAITTAIDRLEHLGYVERTRGAVDRRRILVEPTTEVLRRLDVALSGYAGEAAADTAAYSANEVALLVTFFEQGSARRTRHAARLRELTHER
ncbi:MarR family transcriptional regulator [Actinoplanes nipponensis]|uniref:MarR family transcriptional regulator n=1 Tax=Actinoplanes nipponensis TaxID=135950 RepID=UPI0035E9C2E5